MLSLRGLGLLAAAAVLALPASANAKLTLTPAYDNQSSLDSPMYVTAPAGDTHDLFVVTRPGVIRVAVDGVLEAAPFLDLSNDGEGLVWSPDSGAPSTSEAGMGSMAFDPGYLDPASPGYGLFYVYYSEKPDAGSPDGDIRIDEFKTDLTTSPLVADPSTRREVLEIPHDDESNHYGGTIQFGPDGYLYIGAGDGGGYDNIHLNAQDTKKGLLGKLLRIDPHLSGADPYTIPAGNPFYVAPGHPACATAAPGNVDCPEILAWGLRNPFRWSFDSSTGDLVIGDVGQNQWEEIDYIPFGATLAGDNFGWPCFEGPVAYTPATPGGHPAQCDANNPPPHVDPVASYEHTGGSTAITGGVVVRDPALPSLTGRYLYADFFKGIVHSLVLGTPLASGDRAEALTVPELVAFGQDGAHHVYVVSLEGPVYRLGETTPPVVPPQDEPPPQPPNDPGAGTGVTPATPSSEQPQNPRDTKPPRLAVRAARVQNLLRRHVLRLSVACDERCITRASGSTGGFALHSILKRLDAGKRVLFELRLSSRALRALARHRVAQVRVRGRDAAGNLASASLRVRLPSA